MEVGASHRKRVRVGNAAAAAYVAEEDTDALDCGVCFLPLKPPIFQCEVGHVVCSTCRDRLEAAGKCHVCGVATAGGGYRRCHAMERLVESIRVPCPNAAHGCTMRPAYYDIRNHRPTCEYAPCHCPDEACDFIGSTAVLWDHFSSVHSWPCTTIAWAAPRGARKSEVLGRFIMFGRANLNIRLRDGFNFVLVDDKSDHNQDTASSSKYLFLMNVARQPLGRAISVLWIHPEAIASDGRGQGPSSKEMDFHRSYSFRYLNGSSSTALIDHNQQSNFRVGCTDLSGGLHSLDGCFQFVVPDSVVADSDRDDAIKVEAYFSV